MARPSRFAPSSISSSLGYENEQRKKMLSLVDGTDGSALKYAEAGGAGRKRMMRCCQSDERTEEEGKEGRTSHRNTLFHCFVKDVHLHSIRSKLLQSRMGACPRAQEDEHAGAGRVPVADVEREVLLEELVHPSRAEGVLTKTIVGI